jgi:hypothetical protein
MDSPTSDVRGLTFEVRRLTPPYAFLLPCQAVN